MPPLQPDDSTTTTEKTSVLLRRILADLPGDEVTIGFIVLRLRRRSFGGIFLLLAALGLIPGISFIAGLAILIPAVQLIAGLRVPLLPAIIRRRRIAVPTLRSLGERAIPWIEQAERFIRPRWIVLTRAPMPSVIGAVTISLALAIMLPLPLSNFPPALALAFLSLGFLERDGLMTGIGLILSVVALLIDGFMIAVALRAVSLLIGDGGG